MRGDSDHRTMAWLCVYAVVSIFKWKNKAKANSVQEDGRWWLFGTCSQCLAHRWPQDRIPHYVPPSDVGGLHVDALPKAKDFAARVVGTAPPHPSTTTRW